MILGYGIIGCAFYAFTGLRGFNLDTGERYADTIERGANAFGVLMCFVAMCVLIMCSS